MDFSGKHIPLALLQDYKLLIMKGITHILPYPGELVKHY